MRYAVRGGCCGCGYCAYCCPDLFFIDRDGYAKAEEKEVHTDLASAAAIALANCPCNAIIRTE